MKLLVETVFQFGKHISLPMVLYKAHFEYVLLCYILTIETDVIITFHVFYGTLIGILLYRIKCKKYTTAFYNKTWQDSKVFTALYEVSSTILFQIY